MIKRPMLATKATLSKIKFPVLVSRKLDGIRCFMIGGVAYSRSLKPIPNKYIQRLFKESVPDGVDGEIMLPDVPFRKITSAVMSVEGEPENIEFQAFDYLADGLEIPFWERYKKLSNLCASNIDGPLKLVQHITAKNLEQVLNLHKSFTSAGYEGTMVRDPYGPYKQGRSTVKEGYLLKIKDFADEEASILGYEALFENNNPKTTNALGLSERSTHKGNKVAKEMLGALSLQFKDGTEFGCGTGFTEEQRKELWKDKDSLIGKVAKIKFQGPRNEGEAPRFPVFLGFRDERDLG